MYTLSLGGMIFPVPPETFSLKINGNNQTAELADGAEINLLCTPGLSDVSMTLLLPGILYGFAYYPSGFQPPKYYLQKLELLALGKKPFLLRLSRALPDGTPLHETQMDVTIEGYTATDDAGNGFDTEVKLDLKQYVYRETGLAALQEGADGTLIATPKAMRADMRTSPSSYTVKAGDTLCNIARQFCGGEAGYTALAAANGITNPCKLAVGMVIRLNV